MVLCRRILIAISLGAFLFVISNIGVLNGWLHPPTGYEPLFLVRSHDMAQYVGYLNLSRNSMWVAPNLHAPWALDGALFHPLLLLPGRLGYWLRWRPEFTFQFMNLLFLIAAAAALLYAMDFFLPSSKQRMWAFAAMIAAVPLKLLLVVLRPFLHLPSEFYGLGMIEFAYNSADGLFRGGLSNSYTNSCGTIAVLLGLTFTAKKIVTGKLRFRYLAATTVFLSALLHPFEFAAIVPSSVLAFLFAARSSGRWRTAWTDSLCIAGAALAGLTPTLILTLRYRWISDLSGLFVEQMYPTSLLALYGLPCILVVYFLFLRYRAVTASDQCLLISFLTTAVIVCIPHCLYPPHLLNGFVYITAMLLIRLAFEHRHMQTFYHRRPRFAFGLAAALVILCAAPYISLYLQIWRDGASSDPLLLSTVTSHDERSATDWFRNNVAANRVSTNDLILAPPALAPWFATVPMHSFASHMQQSFNYSKQYREADAFFRGESRDQALALLTNYGVHWVVVPASSPANGYFDGSAMQIGKLRIYELPRNHMKTYPGLAQIIPEAANVPSLSKIVMSWFGLKS